VGSFSIHNKNVSIDKLRGQQLLSKIQKRPDFNLQKGKSRKIIIKSAKANS